MFSFQFHVSLELLLLGRQRGLEVSQLLLERVFIAASQRDASIKQQATSFFAVPQDRRMIDLKDHQTTTRQDRGVQEQTTAAKGLHDQPGLSRLLYEL
eukprot:scaffold795_cov187-Amphora_coffeaeformis.AAC.16